MATAARLRTARHRRSRSRLLLCVASALALMPCCTGTGRAWAGRYATYRSRRRLSVSPLQSRVAFAARFSYVRGGGGGDRARTISKPPTRDFGRVANGQRRSRPLLASILLSYTYIVVWGPRVRHSPPQSPIHRSSRCMSVTSFRRRGKSHTTVVCNGLPVHRRVHHHNDTAAR